MKGFIEDFKNDYKNVFKRALYLASIILTSGMYAFLNTNILGKIYHIPCWIDKIIPFNKYFIIFYLSWYIYIGVTMTYYIVRDEKRYFKLLWGINAGMIACFIVYIFFQTTVPRPEVYGNDVFTILVKFIYGRDNPYNCFPSIHVFESIIIAIYVNRDSSFNISTKLLSSFFALMITISTLYVKQHYFYDAVSGIVLAYGIYAAFNYKELFESFGLKLKQKNDMMVNGREE